MQYWSKLMTTDELKFIFGLYLFHSYAYYKVHYTFIPDEKFDSICKLLLDNWDKFEHRFKHLISKDDLEAGTGYAIQYPPRMATYFNIEVLHCIYDKNNIKRFDIELKNT
jgi:hypothetical protein